MSSRSTTRDRVVASSAERFARRARVARRRPWLLALVGLLVALLAAAAVWLVWFSPVLAVKNVVVEGVSDPVATQVRDQAAIPLGVPLARADLAGAGRRVVSSSTAVESVTVSRRWPTTVVVEVVPRVPVLAVRTASGLRLVDARGVIYADAPAKPTVPVVQSSAAEPSSESLRAVVTMAAALPEGLRKQLADVRVADDGQVSCQLGATRVIWGDETQPQLKVKVIQALLPKKPATINVVSPTTPATS
ncbi:cell division protein FtsQ/DivIB [Arsenicicoccus piscis]|nr:cell division protein FtsQ/DivIB [Arsenicicoccus piscis]